MSVHSADYKKIKKLLDVPEDEPIFIIRGQDDLAAAIVTRYANMANGIEDDKVRPSDEWFDQMNGVVSEFLRFRNENTTKIPD
jgi:hypothetical protein